MANATSEGLSPSSRRVLLGCQRVFLALALGGIATYLYLHRAQLSGMMRADLAMHGLLSVAVFLVLHPVIVASFYAVQRVLGVPRTYQATLSSYLTRLPTRYIPGGIWHSASRYLDVKLEHNAATPLLARIFLLESMVFVSVGLIIGGIWNISLASSLAPDTWLVLAMLVCGGVSALVLVLVVRWMYGMAGVRWLLIALAPMLVVWPAAALSFAQLASPILGVQPSCELASLAGTHVTAANMGYIAIFAPQGWGVTELAFVVLSPCELPPSRVLVSFLAFRLCSLIADTSASGGWLLWQRYRRHAVDILDTSDSAHRSD